MNLIDYKKGFSLLETLVAISLLIFGIIGPLTLAQLSLGSHPHSRDKIIAGYLAQEGLDAIRNYRDSELIAGDPMPLFTPCQANPGCYIDATIEDLSGSQAIKACGGTKCTNGILKLDSVLGYNHQTGSPTKFTRRIFMDKQNLNINNGDGHAFLVTVRVEWSGRFGADQKVEFNDYITDWFEFK